MRVRMRAIAAALVLLVGTAFADPVITGYDVLNTPFSGFGSWAHTYTGTIAAAANPLSFFALAPGTESCP